MINETDKEAITKWLGEKRHKRINSGNIETLIQAWKRETIKLMVHKHHRDVHISTRIQNVIETEYGLDVILNNDDWIYYSRRIYYSPHIDQDIKKEFNKPEAAYILIEKITDNITQALDNKVQQKQAPYDTWKNWFPSTNCNLENLYFDDDENNNEDYNERIYKINKDYVRDQVIHHFIDKQYLQNILGISVEYQDVKDYINKQAEKLRKIALVDGIFSAYNDNRNDFQEGVKIKCSPHTKQEQVDQAISNLVQVLDYFANKNSNRKISTEQQEMLKNNNSFMKIIGCLCSRLPEFMQVSKLGEWAKRYEYRKSIESLKTLAPKFC